MLDRFFDMIQSNRPAMIIALVGFLAGGWVLRMIYDTLKEIYLTWREEREELRAAPEVAEFREYFSTDTDPNLTRERYDEANPRRSLSEGWREFLGDTMPRSPEVVASNVYLESTYAFNAPSPIRAEVEGQRKWPQWTAADLQQVGRHRAKEDPQNPSSWRREFTGEWEQVNSNRKELVSA